MRDEAETGLAGKGGSAELGVADDGDAAKRSRWKRRITLAGVLVVLLAAGVVLPPLVNISRYQRRVTALMTRSLGRPVRMSSVELRLLPVPGFVLHDLAVSEDPGFGAEPILSARTVVATVRLLSLWRGKLEVSRVSVDEASLNLVRSPEGRWNLETLMTGAQAGLAAGAGTAPNSAASLGRTGGVSAHFPYLEATDSRVNLKNGVEKSPFSIVEAELSLWQEEPGKWHVRLRGQPVRTDLEMSLNDTGEVRMEARVRAARQLREMPLDLQMEWRDGQLGQLSRLVTGTDAGWRGDLTADIDVQGTPDSALTKARLRATGVRREEFAPETPLDFDANCSFRYQHSAHALHGIDCNTAIGDGRLRLKAELPGSAGAPEAMLEGNQIPLQAGLDLLRTVRSGFAPGISVKGTATGSLAYKKIAEEKPQVPSRRRGAGKTALPGAGPDEAGENLRGTIVMDGVVLKGGGLQEPLTLPRMVWTPAQVGSSGPSAGVGTRFTLALAPAARVQAGGASSAAPAQAIAISLGLSAQGYEAAWSGTASVARLRELAYAFGLPRLDAADSFSAGSADMDFAASGPWIRGGGTGTAESLSGSVELRRAQWKPAFLALPVDLPQATLAVSPETVAFTADFAYGGAKEKDAEGAKEPGIGAGKTAIRGSVVVHAAARCLGGVSDAAPAPGDCQPQVHLRFGALEAGAVEAALLGAPEEKTMFSPLLDRMRSSDRPKWPPLAVTAEAESLALGAVTLHGPSLRLRFRENEVAIQAWQADLLGGTAQGTGRVEWTGGTPQYALDGSFARVSAAPLGALLGSRWTGGPVSGSGSIQLAGLTAKELSDSAAGDVRFDWRRGAFSGAQKDAPEVRFEDWSGMVGISGGKAQIGENALIAGRGNATVAGAIPFAGPAKLAVTPSQTRLVAHAGESASLPAVK